MRPQPHRSCCLLPRERRAKPATARHAADPADVGSARVRRWLRDALTHQGCSGGPGTPTRRHTGCCVSSSNATWTVGTRSWAAALPPAVDERGVVDRPPSRAVSAADSVPSPVRAFDAPPAMHPADVEHSPGRLSTSGAPANRTLVVRPYGGHPGVRDDPGAWLGADATYAPRLERALATALARPARVDAVLRSASRGLDRWRAPRGRASGTARQPAGRQGHTESVRQAGRLSSRQDSRRSR